MVVWFPLYQSRYLRRLHWLQCLFAALTLWHGSWPFLAQIVLFVLLVKFAFHQPTLPEALYFNSEGVQLVYRQNSVPAQLGARCYCGEYWILLAFEVQDCDGLLRRKYPRRLLLLPDSSSPDAWRRLRIYLRWYAQLHEHVSER